MRERKRARCREKERERKRATRKEKARERQREGGVGEWGDGGVVWGGETQRERNIERERRERDRESSLDFSPSTQPAFLLCIIKVDASLNNQENTFQVKY